TSCDVRVRAAVKGIVDIERIRSGPIYEYTASKPAQTNWGSARTGCRRASIVNHDACMLWQPTSERASGGGEENAGLSRSSGVLIDYRPALVCDGFHDDAGTTEQAARSESGAALLHLAA